MSDQNNSRVDKNVKRRRNSKFIALFLSIGVVLVFLMIGFWIFGGSGDVASEDPVDTENADEDYFLEMEEDEDVDSGDQGETNDEAEDSSDEQAENETEELEEENQENEDIVTEETEPSDENVEEAFTGNWPAIDTTQSGPHTTVYDKGSQDRIEIKEAVSLATGINGNDMIEWWVENGGDQQKVIATVSDQAETETFRVYLSWVDNEGWQPTKVETLIVNDKK